MKCSRGHAMRKGLDLDRSQEVRDGMARMGFVVSPYTYYCPICNPELIAKYSPQKEKPLTKFDADMELLFGPRPLDLPQKRGGMRRL